MNPNLNDQFRITFYNGNSNISFRIIGYIISRRKTKRLHLVNKNDTLIITS